MIIREYTNAQASVMAIINQCQDIEAEYRRYERRYKEALAYEDYTVSESLKEDLNELSNKFNEHAQELRELRRMITDFLGDGDERTN